MQKIIAESFLEKMKKNDMIQKINRIKVVIPRDYSIDPKSKDFWDEVSLIIEKRIKEEFPKIYLKLDRIQLALSDDETEFVLLLLLYLPKVIAYADDGTIFDLIDEVKKFFNS